VSEYGLATTHTNIEREGTMITALLFGLATGLPQGGAKLAVEAAPMAASAQTLASRATVTPSQTVFGGFQLAQEAPVIILVRGNSLQTLGVTNNYLDAPRVRVYNAAGADLIVDATGRPGTNTCTSGAALSAPAVAYYASVRGQPAHERDTCIAAIFPAGAYTFTVTPSIAGVTVSAGQSNPSSGEMLFEVTLAP
jgi:hypothetical protein